MATNPYKKYLGLSQTDALKKDLTRLEEVAKSLDAQINAHDDKELFRFDAARSVIRSQVARARDTRRECQETIDRLIEEIRLAEEAEASVKK